MWKTTFLLLLATIALVSSSGLEQFNYGNNLFIASVYKGILKSNNKENFLVSPFSVGLVLALAQSGAKDLTAQEILSALHQPSQNQINSALAQLLPALRRKKPYTLHTANKIYIRNSFSINPSFLELARNLYQSETENIDFSRKREAAHTINSWVESQTNNKIRNLLDASSISRQTRAILINALYFQGNWSNPFEGFLTKKLNFNTFTSKIQVDTMRNHNNDYKYFESAELDARFLEMPFEGEDASMVIVLPNQILGLQTLERQIEKVLERHAFILETVNVALPKFKIENKWDFKKILSELGVIRAFRDDYADFSGIAGVKGDLVINKVIQKCFVDVNEEGVEAAAASYIDAIVPLSGNFPVQPPKEFYVDHPFIFYIKVGDVILFIGRVSKPSF